MDKQNLVFLAPLLGLLLSFVMVNAIDIIVRWTIEKKRK